MSTGDERGALPDDPESLGDVRLHALFRRVLEILRADGAPHLVGGGWALKLFTGIRRRSPDLDVFLREADFERVAAPLRAEGLAVERVFAHWLGKVRDGEDYVDLIFNSGNGVAAVDDAWFQHATRARLFGVPVLLVPPEEMIWTKAFVMERERCDIADVAHLLRAFADRLDWPRLLDRFGAHWRVLLAHVVLYGFVYPGATGRVPPWVIDELTARLQEDARPTLAEFEGDAAPPLADRDLATICQGTLLSREQFLVDLEDWGLRDARLPPTGSMRTSQVERWTEAIPAARRLR